MSVSGTDSVSHSIPADTAIIEIGAQNAMKAGTIQWDFEITQRVFSLLILTSTCQQ